MSFTVSRGGLLVGLAVFGVIVYELRTVVGFVGIDLPILPYLAGVFVLAGVGVWLLVINGGWQTEPGSKESS